MEQKYVNLLTLTEYYLVSSTITDKPYIDEALNCYLFTKKSDAEAFSGELKDTKVLDAKTYRLQFITELYGYGVKNIRVMTRESKFSNIPVEKADAAKQYANPETCRNLILLKQTLKKKYAKALKKGMFIAPILIDPRFEKRYPELHYSYATFDGNDRYYVLFTTLKEFEKWNAEQPQDWKPVEMQLYKVGRIRKNNSVLINPLSDKVILQDRQISEILKG